MKIRDILKYLAIALPFGLAAFIIINAPASKAADAGLVSCTQSVNYDAASIQTLKLITGTTGDSIYICGWASVNAATGAFQLVTGTGTNCATNQQNLTPNFVFPSAGPFVMEGAIWKGIKVDKNIDVCLKATVAVATQLILFYNQK